MELEEKKLASEQIYKGKILTLERDTVELPDGKRAIREVIRHNGGVCILAVDAQDQVLLVRQFRYPYGKTLLELPAGKLEPGEDPMDCAVRELEEETGYAAEHMIPLGEVYPTPGYTSETLYLYLAQGLQLCGQHLDEDEFLNVEKMPFDAALQRCLDGTLRDGKTIVAVLKYNELRRCGKGMPIKEEEVGKRETQKL